MERKAKQMYEPRPRISMKVASSDIFGEVRLYAHCSFQKEVTQLRGAHVRPFWYRRESAGEAGCPFRNRMATNYAISLSSETTSISWIRVNFSLGLPFGLPRSISAASSISQF